MICVDGADQANRRFTLADSVLRRCLLLSLRGLASPSLKLVKSRAIEYTLVKTWLTVAHRWSPWTILPRMDAGATPLGVRVILGRCRLTSHLTLFARPDQARKRDDNGGQRVCRRRRALHTGRLAFPFERWLKTEAMRSTETPEDVICPATDEPVLARQASSQRWGSGDFRLPRINISWDKQICQGFLG